MSTLELDRDDDQGTSRLTEGDQEALATRAARKAGRGGQEVRYGNPEVVTTMPCRRCRKPVEVTETGLEMFQGFNRHLAKLGQEPTLADQVMACDECRALVQIKRAEHARKVCDGLAEAVRTLKSGCGGDKERAAVAYLQKHDNDAEATLAHWREYHAKKRGSGAGPAWERE